MPGSARQRIAVAMSGGIDSSVVAAWLVDQGHEVIGFTAHMWQEGSRCCSREDIERARLGARFLGIPHYVVNALALFNTEVVDPFLKEYARGRTPSPCILCNASVKFGLLLERARQLECTALATGHYARCETRADGVHLRQAADIAKDQSYYLHRLNQSQLRHTLFPLATWTKDEVQAFARRRNLPVTFREESQDLCFVPPGQLTQFLETHQPGLRQTGIITTRDGRILGQHDGIHQFTVGQRKGLGIAVGAPLYVIALDVARNAVIVGPEADARTGSFHVETVHWIAGHPPALDRTYDVRIRYRATATPARLSESGTHTLAVRLATPQFGVAPGQAAVFYDGDEVLGGGWITAA